MITKVIPIDRVRDREREEFVETWVHYMRVRCPMRRRSDAALRDEQVRLFAERTYNAIGDVPRRAGPKCAATSRVDQTLFILKTESNVAVREIQQAFDAFVTAVTTTGPRGPLSLTTRDPCHKTTINPAPAPSKSSRPCTRRRSR